MALLLFGHRVISFIAFGVVRDVSMSFPGNQSHYFCIFVPLGRKDSSSQSLCKFDLVLNRYIYVFYYVKMGDISPLEKKNTCCKLFCKQLATSYHYYKTDLCLQHIRKLAN